MTRAADEIRAELRDLANELAVLHGKRADAKWGAENGRTAAEIVTAERQLIDLAEALKPLQAQVDRLLDELREVEAMTHIRGVA